METIPTHVEVTPQLLKRLAQASAKADKTYSHQLEALSKVFGASNYRHFKAATEAPRPPKVAPVPQQRIAPDLLMSLVLSTLNLGAQDITYYAQAMGFPEVPQPQYDSWLARHYSEPLNPSQCHHLWAKYQFQCFTRAIALVILEEDDSQDNILECRSNSRHSVDITDKLLSLSLKEFQALEDNQYNSDSLATSVLAKQKHEGPYAVRVESYLEQWLESHCMPARSTLTETDWTEIRSRYQAQPYEVSWSKTYCATGTITVKALGPGAAEEAALDQIGDLTGSMQYDPDQDTAEAYWVGGE
jgi:hypothetical protein